ncbi:MAG TPA: FG-GAP-like repeat-containing protein, partial [Sumerlaeia bacterium]|nr:FG-GAP-like repeat-containing protein [Sumerlaeia bacterium]
MTSRSSIPAALAALALLAFGAAARAQEDAARRQTETAKEPTAQAAAAFRLPLPGAGLNGGEGVQGHAEIGATVGGATSPLDPKEAGPIDNSGRVPQDVVSGDFNRDGLADLAIAFAFDDAVRWYYGRGDGTFSFQGEAEVGIHPGPLNDLPRALLAHDFDGDGFADLAVLCSGNPGPPQATDPSLGILYGDPVGGFEPFRPVALAPDLSSPPRFSIALAAGTIDADDRLDLVVGHFDSNQVSIVLHAGRRRWKTPLLIPVATVGGGPTAFSIADFDFDGATDLVVANRKDLQLWRGNGTGEFPWRAAFAEGADLTAIAAADLDEDGLWDLVALDGASQSVDLHMGLRADGSAERLLALPLLDNASFPAGQGPADLVLYDADLDGRDDLALIYLVSGGGSLFLSQPRAAVPQEADASLPLRFHHSFATAEKPRAIVAADFNRDGMKDLAVIHEGDGAVASNQDLVVQLNTVKQYRGERLIPQSSSVPGRQLAAYLGRPRGLAWDPIRNALWTLDREERRLVRLSPESHVQFSVSLKTLSADPPVDPTDLAVDGHGYLWITDRLSASVFRFRPGMGTDSLKRVFSTTGAGLLRPSGIAVDHDADRLLISDER